MLLPISVIAIVSNNNNNYYDYYCPFIYYYYYRSAATTAPKANYTNTGENKEKTHRQATNQNIRKK